MSKDKKYLIGEFSKKTRTSIRTLHYYDEIGLLKAEKAPQSGRRLYTDQDVLKLQKIIVFKFLGYRLEEIATMMNEERYDSSLKESLQTQKQALVEKKDHIETALKAIDRTVTLLEEVEEVNSDILMSLVQNIQTESEQRLWIEQLAPNEVIDQLFDKTEEEMLALDIEFIELSNEIKRLMNRPFDDPEVQKLVEKHMEATMEFVGEEAMGVLGELSELAVEDFEKIIPSPYTEEEEKWLQQAMEHYMIQVGIYTPDKE